MTTKEIEKELKKASEAINALPFNHELADEDFKEMQRNCFGGRNAGQSYNAMFAEQRGELTLSKLPKALRRMVDCGAGNSTMWHHTGMFKGRMNETTFYAGCDFDLEKYKYFLENKEEIELQKKAEAEQLAAKQVEYENWKKEKETKKKAWLETHAEYVVRTTERLSIEEKREMNGKYGWFDSSTKSYNLTEYFTGYKLKEGVNIDEFYKIS